MTRPTTEAAVAVRLPDLGRGWIYDTERCPWMAEALAQPLPTKTPIRLFLELHDALVDARYPTIANFAQTREWVNETSDAVESWFFGALAGQARIELSPEDLWALFQLVNQVRDVVDWSAAGAPRELPGQDTDVCWTDFDEPVYVRVVS